MARLLTHNTPAGVASAAADAIVRAVNRHKGHRFNLALSGGSTPPLIFRRLRRLAGRGFAPERLRLFWIDERCVPISHPDSNAGSARKHLGHVWNAADVRAMSGELAPAVAAQAYARRLQYFGGAHAFDMALVGLGPDGHVASLFPGTDALEARDTVTVGEAPSGDFRISVTMPVLRSARSLLVVACGESKAWAVREALSGRPVSPFARACSGRPRVEIHADAACSRAL
ncbi:6-phosphogluconolactonase [Maricaulis salignorans]|uniref:6-phosphogluconolactonase n=1 Tax=Maricaulis salignorans TaxID=144026 RepID=A0A1G9QPK6_9PROT|nr:6-phosphogluconolactonase [Maricaulis salignorans]SDM12944.1 6-phosphogluconolactonase [Maricaulis salignorans]